MRKRDYKAKKSKIYIHAAPKPKAESTEDIFYHTVLTARDIRK